jgi:hypothetical protein
VLRHRKGAVRRLLDAARDCGSGQYKRAKEERATSGALASCQPHIATLALVFEKEISSPSRRHSNSRLSVESHICPRAVFRMGGPYPRHPKEMPLQSRASNVAHQLHALCCQARALKRMLSQVV